MSEPVAIRNPKREFGCSGCLLTLAGLWLALSGIQWWFGPIRYLQFHASNITDIYDDAGAGFTGDFTRQITANCTEEVSHLYAAQCGLHERFGDVRPDWISGERAGLPFNLKGAYFNHPKADYVQVIAWENGKLYHLIDAW